MMEFYSHLEPEVILLRDHLQHVGNRSQRIINSKEFNNIDKYIISDVSYLIGISHDFGKYATFFQEKLKGLKDKNDPLTYHGLISAFFAFEVVNEYIKTKNLVNQRPYKFLPLLAYFVVKRHHLDLDDIEDDIRAEKLFDAGFRNLNNQLEDIGRNKSQIEDDYSTLLRSHTLSYKKIFVNMWSYKKEIKSSSDIKPLIKDLDMLMYFFKKKSNKEVIYYLLVQLLYSVLIDSDKKHAGHIREIERKELPECLVEEYLAFPEFEEDNKSNINHIRNEIRESVLKNIRDPKNINQRLFTLTAPTGTGKTLTSFSAALILRNKLKKALKLENEPRIIYSLPFTSIIDQSYNVFVGVLRQIDGFEKSESEYLMKHHYLSEIFYKTGTIDKEKDVDESLALIESWESEIIVTTFIQLFHTLIGYKNRSLKKFHNIVNSIIILDEVQNIPIEYWKLVEEILAAITTYFNCRIILMTATKPLIFEEGTYKELVDDYDSYFNRVELNRVCLNIDSNCRQVSEFCNSFDDLSKNSYLFVLNTINSSLEFYTAINKRIHELGLDFRVCYLSTNIIPKERKKRIEKIRKAIKSGQKIVIVSTQLIEAGVDIDCNCVYRDMGPLDSIIQVAGRCNRNKKLEQSDMYLINLVDKDNRPFTGIYDPVLLNVVKQILDGKSLNGKSQIPESGFLRLINEFFEVAKAKSRMETKLINSIYELYYYDRSANTEKRKPISNFELIKEDYFKLDVFIEVDDKAKEIWKTYGEIRAVKDPFERKKKFLAIKKDFYDYVISVAKTYEKQVGFDEKLGMGYISKTEIDHEIGYDPEVGFKKASPRSGTLIL
jgi:CRISPR-associated endonuclease/helicase Cas3